MPPRLNSGFAYHRVNAYETLSTALDDPALACHMMSAGCAEYNSDYVISNTPKECEHCYDSAPTKIYDYKWASAMGGTFSTNLFGEIGYESEGTVISLQGSNALATTPIISKLTPISSHPPKDYSAETHMPSVVQQEQQPTSSAHTITNGADWQKSKHTRNPISTPKDKWFEGPLDTTCETDNPTIHLHGQPIFKYCPEIHRCFCDTCKADKRKRHRWMWEENAYNRIQHPSTFDQTVPTSVLMRGDILYDLGYSYDPVIRYWNGHIAQPEIYDENDDLVNPRDLPLKLSLGTLVFAHVIPKIVRDPTKASVIDNADAVDDIQLR
ncbi:hypothetical protein BJ165DRAFT_1409777 [Panaeolus papilionaceus]|nr:hypothetical protein BJ165DRAFT_1409777 [Panaeolus papilionaceus]